MKNRNIGIILFILLSSCSNSKSTTKITIKYVDLEIFTPSNVDCNNFKTYFDSDVKIKVLQYNQSVEFIKQIVSFTERAKKYNGKVDTRLKVEILTNTDIKEEICIGNNLVSFKGNIYENDDDFRHYLEKCLAVK